MVTATRLPGIQFEVVAPPANETLVRMDIAAFVGFAANGPLHQPVAVEDIADFEEIFGEDLVLASTAESNQPLYAYLPSAVRAFFRNGGRRCWVIRVADADQAESGLFPLPGLFRLEGEAIAQTLAPARSPGSWSDSLIAGLALRSHPVVVTSFQAGATTVGLSLDSPGEVAPGDLLRFSFPGTNSLFWFFVDALDAAPNTSPPSIGRGRFVEATGSVSHWQRLLSPPPPASLPICERITMDLFAQNSTGKIWSLTDLGFSPLHPRYWGMLPDDASLFAAMPPSGLVSEARHPRFPIAGPDADPTKGGFFLPLGVASPPSSPPVAPIRNEQTAGFFPTTGPEHSSASVLYRDGLASFGKSLFLDRSLAESDSLDLLNEAFHIQYQNPTPRKLKGIHAALEIEEATIIAVPDAMHRGWFQTSHATLSAPPASSPLSHPEQWHLDCQAKQPANELPVGEFEPCNPRIVAPPSLQLRNLGGGRYSLSWTPLASTVDDLAIDFLEEAVDSNFATATVKRQTSSGNVTIYGQPPGDYYYRVRRQIGTVSSDYSNGVAIRIDGATGWQEAPVATYQDQDLLDIHRALLRMSAARGDLFAVLAVPGHYRERETAAHASQLKGKLENESATLSFGGVYHPWLIGREEDDLSNLRSTPPEGAMAGIMAKRSSQRGAWISPANEKLSGVVALSPPILRASRQLLQDSQVNLIRQEANGFLCLSALTLSNDDDLLPINVRRLLSFLRKTALLVGNAYVFEPLSDLFRRGVQRGFEKVLSLLAQRGAFAGRTESESFQVVTDSRVNTPAAADLGRFYVDLRVAPSLPMRFLTIRLLQTADRTFVTEGQ